MLTILVRLAMLVFQEFKKFRLKCIHKFNFKLITLVSESLLVGCVRPPHPIKYKSSRI